MDFVAYAQTQLAPVEPGPAMPAETFDRFAGSVPPGLVAWWRAFGTGSLLGGRLRILDPLAWWQHRDALLSITTNVPAGTTPFPVLRTAFGNYYLWDSSAGMIGAVWPAIGRFAFATPAAIRSFEAADEVFAGFVSTCSTATTDVRDARTGAPLFDDAVARYGPLTASQVYVPVPYPFLGGAFTADTLDPGDAAVSVAIATQFIARLKGPQ